MIPRARSGLGIGEVVVGGRRGGGEGVRIEIDDNNVSVSINDVLY